MTTALVIGGTRFVGRHLVAELRSAGYEVALFNRGRHPNPFADRADVRRIEGDREREADLRSAADAADPDAVFDCVAYRPDDVATAVGVFADVDAYVYVSSSAAYGAEHVPKREDGTPLCPCSAEQATDDSRASYGPRKAEGDREVFAAAERGVAATSVRPPVVYGPHDYTGRHDYWFERVAAHDRVVVPGNGTLVRHRAYVEDVASALRIVAERGEPGEAYNVGDRRVLTLTELVEAAADALGTGVEVVDACERDVRAAGLDPGDFPLYRRHPHVLSTAKLHGLGWDATPPGAAIEHTVAAFREQGPADRVPGPGRAAEERVLSAVDER